MRLWLFLLILSIVLPISGQGLEATKSIKIPSADRVEMDQFGNIYLIKGQELQKLNPEGKFEASYSDPIQGDISRLDLLNPMNPLIYFQNSNLLRVLDNRLNQNREHNLSFYFQDPQNIAAADETSIWLYDQNSDRMINFDLNGLEIRNQSPIISQIIGEDENRVLNFKSGFDQLILHVSEMEQESLLVFDAQGAFEKKIKLPFKLKSWHYHNQEMLVLYENNSLQVHRLAGESSTLIINPLNESQEVFFFPPKIYIQRDRQLNQYLLTDGQ